MKFSKEPITGKFRVGKGTKGAKEWHVKSKLGERTVVYVPHKDSVMWPCEGHTTFEFIPVMKVYTSPKMDKIAAMLIKHLD